MKIEMNDIYKAGVVLKEHIQTTNLDLSQNLSRQIGCSVYLKYENCQRTGSFKIRGALNKISSLSEGEKSRGIVTSSAGNHAQGVAWAATSVGVTSHVVMPETAPVVKIDATKGYGANVILKGQIYDDACEYGKDLAKQKGYIFIPPYEDTFIIAGQGTIGLEVLDNLPDVSSVLIPVGGGGLASGIAFAVKTLKPKCRVIGVQAESAPSMAETFRKKQIQVIPPSSSALSVLADGVSVKTPSEMIYNRYLSKLLDDLVTVNDDQIMQSILFLLERTKTLVEGAGALTTAAALYKNLSLTDRTVLILSGGNMSLDVLAQLIQKGYH